MDEGGHARFTCLRNFQNDANDGFYIIIFKKWESITITHKGDSHVHT